MRRRRRRRRRHATDTVEFAAPGALRYYYYTCRTANRRVFEVRDFVLEGEVCYCKGVPQAHSPCEDKTSTYTPPPPPPSSKRDETRRAEQCG